MSWRLQLPLDLPPRNDAGEVIPHDHQQIDDAHGVIRRISHHHLVRDEKSGGLRISTLAFTPSSGMNGGMSVDLENSIIEAGLNPKQHVINPPFIGAVKFTAGQLRSQQLLVGYDPLPENPHHGEVWGDFSKPKKKQLQQVAEIFVAPQLG